MLTARTVLLCRIKFNGRSQIRRRRKSTDRKERNTISNTPDTWRKEGVEEWRGRGGEGKSGDERLEGLERGEMKGKGEGNGEILVEVERRRNEGKSGLVQDIFPRLK